MFSLFGILRRSVRTNTARYSTALEHWLAEGTFEVPGAGRSVFAATDIALGQTVLDEHPLVCTPGAFDAEQACYHCVRSLQPGGRVRLRGRWFCSAACRDAAMAEYLPEAAGVDHAFRQPAAVQAMSSCTFGRAGARCLRPFSELEAACDEAGERFPLLAMRLACAALTAAALRQQPLEGWKGEAPAAWRGDSLTDMRLLAFANVPRPPPEPWRQTYGLLRRGVDRFAASSVGAAEPAVAAAAAGLTLEWYADTLARLHVNAFRVDTARPPSRGRTLAALAAAVVAGASGGRGGATGSALYLLGSLFNHSCAPNLDVLFPAGNAKLRLRAARDIPAGEQLFIAYLDVDLPVARRQEKLHFGYGFHCMCERCVEEL